MRQRGLAEPVGGGAEARVQPAQGTGYRTRGPGCGWAGPWGERHRLGMVACTRGRGLGSSCVHGQGPGSRKAGKAPSLHLWGGGQLPVPPWGPGPPSGHCRLGGRAIILSPAASPGVSEGGAPERSLEFPGPRCQGPHLAAGCTQREAGLWRGAQARPGHGLPAQGALQRPCGLPWAWARGRLQGEQTSQQTNTLGCCMGVRITKPGGARREVPCQVGLGQGRQGVCHWGERTQSQRLRREPRQAQPRAGDGGGGGGGRPHNSNLATEGTLCQGREEGKPRGSTAGGAPRRACWTAGTARAKALW